MIAAVVRLSARVTGSLLLCFLLAACGERGTITINGETQGTTYHITIVPDTQVDVADLRLQIEERLRALDRALSNYDPESELSRFNAAPAGEWFELGPDLYRVLKTSEEMSRISNGAFDVTLVPVLELWGFGPGATASGVPDAAAIEAARALVGFQYLELDPQQPRARKQRALRIDINGIAQGYCVDRLAELLEQSGYRNFLAEIGGELRLMGASPRGTPWRIAIDQPVNDAGAVQQAIAGSGIGITTAGDYREYFESAGRRYSHTIDPRSGRPIDHNLASVTVIAASAEYADGMDTVLEVLGPEEGYALAERLGVAAYFVIRSGDTFTVRYTKAFARYLAD